MYDRRRDRVGEMVTLKGSETVKDARGFLARLDVFKVELEKVEDRGTVGNRGALKHASKGREASGRAAGRPGGPWPPNGVVGAGREWLWNVASNWLL